MKVLDLKHDKIDKAGFFIDKRQEINRVIGIHTPVAFIERDWLGVWNEDGSFVPYGHVIRLRVFRGRLNHSTRQWELWVSKRKDRRDGPGNQASVEFKSKRF